MCEQELNRLNPTEYPLAVELAQPNPPALLDAAVPRDILEMQPDVP